MLVIPPPLRSDRLSVRFTLCDGPIHVNCVVDGDTFWFRGDKIRIADMTPRKSSRRDAEARSRSAKSPAIGCWSC
ncbi:endonuclease YncB(thermonuclease family) [Bradyrhizobium japonicum]